MGPPTAHATRRTTRRCSGSASRASTCPRIRTRTRLRSTTRRSPAPCTRATRRSPSCRRKGPGSAARTATRLFGEERRVDGVPRRLQPRVLPPDVRRPRQKGQAVLARPVQLCTAVKIYLEILERYYRGLLIEREIEHS